MRYLTIEEFAKELRIPKREVQRKIRAGLIPVIDLGRKTKRIDLDAIKAKPVEQPTQAEVGRVLRRGRGNERRTVPDYLGDL